MNISLKKSNVHTFLSTATKNNSAQYSYHENIIHIFCKFRFRTVKNIVINMVKSSFHDDYNK